MEYLKTHNFSLELIIGKIEPDGESSSNFILLDYQEIVTIEKLEQKLSEFYKKGIEKIKEINNIIKDK